MERTTLEQGNALLQAVLAVDAQLFGLFFGRFARRVLLVVVSTPEELEDLTKLAPSALKHCLRQQAADRRDRYGEALALQVANLKRQIGKLFLDFYL